MTEIHSKTPSERRRLRVGVAGMLMGALITGVTAEAVARGLVPGPALEVTATVTDTGADLEVAGGTDGEVYRVDLAFSLSDDQTLEQALEVHVIDLDFAASDRGPSAYIAPADYLARFGLEELILLTADPHAATRTVGKTRFFAALSDAAAEVDAALAARYHVPVTNPPAILAAHAATLTREILHRYADAMPEHVAAAAKTARAALGRLASGDTGLPGLVVRSADTGGMPQFEAGSAHFSSDRLKVF